MKEKQRLNTLGFSRAYETINKIGLNRNDLVLNERKRNIIYYGKRLKLSLTRLLGAEIKFTEFERNINDILSEIKGKCSVNKEYSFFWKFFYRNFNHFIEGYIKPKYRPKIFQIVNTYQNQNFI